MEAVLSGIVGAIGPVGVTGVLILLGLLSQRLGAVTGRPPRYRWLYLAAGLTGLSAVLRVLASALADLRLSLAYGAVFALGVTLGLIAAWPYWGWLFGERQVGSG